MNSNQIHVFMMLIISAAVHLNSRSAAFILRQSSPLSRVRTRLYTNAKPKRRTYKDDISSRLGDSAVELGWENFDFSDNPKTDIRFNKGKLNGMDVTRHTHLNEEEEAKEDRRIAQQLQDANEAVLKLDPVIVAEATSILEEYINDDRLERVKKVLHQRTKRSKFLFENPANPSNVWACLRTIDSFGIQNVDLIIDSGRYSGKKALTQKRGMRTAMGSAQWLTLRNYQSTDEAVQNIRKQGYKIYASDLNPNSKDVRDVDWDSAPICVVMGNEDQGISDEMRELADETFTLPMCGFAESFNLSVATSITLAHMSSKSQKGKGPLRPDLDDHEYNCLYLKVRTFNSSVCS